MLQIQQILHDRYCLKKILGQNAGRQTWLAIDHQTGTPVVVKLLTCTDRVQWDQVRLFEREAQVLQHLDHPQIPQYRDSFCLDDHLLWFALVQSYIPGRSLKQLLEQGKVFKEAGVRQIAEQILLILIYLHELSPPVLHRDIKPGNLLLDKAGKIHLVDFGAVQDRAAKEGATFTIVGTYGYAPLEQFGGRASPASDLYALGATLIHLVTGVAPSDLPQMQGRLQFAHLVSLNPGLVRWLWRLTEANIDRRFPSAREALEALHQNQMAISTTVVGQPCGSTIKLQKSSQRLDICTTRQLQEEGLIELGVVLGVAIVGLVLLFVIGSPVGLILLILILIPWSLTRGINALDKGYATYVRLDRQHFAIRWQWFAFHRHIRGQTIDINAVSYQTLEGVNKVFPGVKITVGVSEHLITSLNPSLTVEESFWLREEIQQWLGLK